MEPAAPAPTAASSEYIGKRFPIWRSRWRNKDSATLSYPTASFGLAVMSVYLGQSLSASHLDTGWGSHTQAYTHHLTVSKSTCRKHTYRIYGPGCCFAAMPSADDSLALCRSLARSPLSIMHERDAHSWAWLIMCTHSPSLYLSFTPLVAVVVESLL